MVLRVGAYERISDDKEEEARGVARQAADNEAQAKLRGWKVAEHYQDNDFSAFKENVTRPAFERLLADLESGVLDGVVVYNQDRFVRQPSDLERAIRVYDRAKAAGRQLVFATVSGDLDLGSDDGITMARVMVAFANKASRDTARRVARKHLEFAQEGRPISAWRPFGWQEDRRTLEPKEAEAIRDGVRKLLAGVPLAEICRQWNIAGILTPRGNAWVSTAARQVFRNPRLVGQRIYKAEIIRDLEGQPVLGQWEPILTVPEWEALQAELDSPERTKGVAWQKGQKTLRKYLLSGLARCAACSAATLRGNAATYRATSKQPARKTHAYNCASCGKVSISGPALDGYVADVFLGRLARMATTEPSQEPWGGEAELARVQEQMSELMAAYRAGELPGTVVFPEITTLDGRRTELLAERGQWEARHAKPMSEPARLLADWERMTTAEKRAALEVSLGAILVRPAKTRSPIFDPSRVDLVWLE
jgi:DNA invertase Pin-like site-specific DNA recombinase